VDFIISLLSAKARRLTNDLSWRFEIGPTSIIGALVLHFLQFLPYWLFQIIIELKRRLLKFKIPVSSFKITNLIF
jgi:hypothetical protein